MTLNFEQADTSLKRDARFPIEISDTEIIELASAFRRFGYFRNDLSKGELYLSREAAEIHGLPPGDGPVPLTELVKTIHPDDLSDGLQAFEEGVAKRKGWAHIFRMKDGNGYKLVRLVASFRENGTAEGEIIGIIYEFFERIGTAQFDDA
jgi:hypothetical protein